MRQEENITMPRWFLERIEDTLRIQNNINLDKKSGETCQDRNVKESLNGIRKLLRGEELTGGERLERLQPPLTPSEKMDLEKEMSRFIWEYFKKPDYDKDFIAEVDWEKSMKECARYFYELDRKV